MTKMLKNMHRFRDRGIFGFFTLIFGIYVLVSNDIGTIWGEPDLMTTKAAFGQFNFYLFRKIEMRKGFHLFAT